MKLGFIGKLFSAWSQRPISHADTFIIRSTCRKRNATFCTGLPFWTLLYGLSLVRQSDSHLTDQSSDFCFSINAIVQMTTRMHIITLMIMMIIMTRAMSIMTIILNPVNIPMTTLVILDGIIQSFKLIFFRITALASFKSWPYCPLHRCYRSTFLYFHAINGYKIPKNH